MEMLKKGRVLKIVQVPERLDVAGSLISDGTSMGRQIKIHAADDHSEYKLPVAIQSMKRFKKANPESGVGSEAIEFTAVLWTGHSEAKYLFQEESPPAPSRWISFQGWWCFSPRKIGLGASVGEITWVGDSDIPH